MSNIFEIDDEIVEIEYIGEQDTIDINTSGNRLFYANGILTHNSSVQEIEFDHSHIGGGISKIQSADNVFGIYTSRELRERGRYQIQILKTRSSSGVGSKVTLGYDVETLRISDIGEEESESTQSNIVTKIKNNLNKNSQTNSEDSNTVTSETQGTQIRNLIKKMKTQNLNNDL